MESKKIKLTEKNRVVFMLLICLVVILMFFPLAIQAENTQEEVPQQQSIRGKVLDIVIDFEKQEQMPSIENFKINYYKAEIKILSGKHNGETIYAEHTINEQMVYNLKVEKGDQVLLYLEEDEQGQIINAYISEIYRQNYLTYLLILFLATLVVFGGIKGLKTIVTLGITGLAIFKLLLPGILAGYNPIILTVAICALVTALTLFIVSGANKKTISAIIGTTGGVLTAGLIALVFGSLAKLSGLGENEAQMLAFIPREIGFDFEGLLFAGIILGSLGAVMDVGMSIASSMYEIQDVKPDITAEKLIRSGMNVGRDVMGTMSNTLILAYTGASMPLLLLFIANQVPFSEFINWDMIASEVVRSIAGSIGLILTIPLTALVTAGLRSKKNLRNKNNT